jgi:hypothetical protein
MAKLLSLANRSLASRSTANRGSTSANMSSVRADLFLPLWAGLINCVDAIDVTLLSSVNGKVRQAQTYADSIGTQLVHTSTCGSQRL